MAEPVTTTPSTKPDVDRGKRLVLVLGLVMQLLLMAAGLWPAAWLVLHFAPAARSAWQWVVLILAAVVVFNFIYLAALLLLRLLTPIPKEGRYELRLGQRPPAQVIILMLNFLLAKARYEPPWAATFSAVMARVWPFGAPYRRLFGPHSTSTTLGDTIFCLDPWHVHAGAGVQFGYHCVIICHHFDNRGLIIRPVRIGDHAVIGGESLLMAGVEVGHHAVVASRAMVMPDTRIGPYELWAGSPARFVKLLSTDEVTPTLAAAALTGDQPAGRDRA